MTGAGIRVALFDLDDTLFAHRLAVERGIVAHRATLGPAAAAADESAEVARWNALEEHHYHRYLAGELDFVGQRRARARDFAAPFGVVFESDAAAERWFDDYFAEYRRNWSLHDDALRCLDALPGMRIGIITNGDLEFQTAKIRRVELEHRVEHVITSGELGIAKPDARIFEHAAAAFGVDVSEAAYIGDRLGTDALGAAAAGMRGVWLDRPGIATADQLAEASEAGVAVIRTLDELPHLLS